MKPQPPSVSSRMIIGDALGTVRETHLGWLEMLQTQAAPLSESQVEQGAMGLSRRAQKTILEPLHRPHLPHCLRLPIPIIEPFRISYAL